MKKQYCVTIPALVNNLVRVVAERVIIKVSYQNAHTISNRVQVVFATPVMKGGGGKPNVRFRNNPSKYQLEGGRLRRDPKYHIEKGGVSKKRALRNRVYENHMGTWLLILVFFFVRVLTEHVIKKASYHNAHTINCNVSVNSCSFRWDTLMRGGQNIVFFGPIPQYWAQYWVPPPDPIPNTILGSLIYWSLLLLFVLLQYRLHCITRSYVPWGHL